jgi:hypothetical protein
MGQVMTNIVDLNDYRAPVKLPEALRNAKTWLVWRLTHVPGEPKPRKVPYYISGAKRYGEQGTDKDRAQLVSFERAVATCIKGHYSGVGFAMLATNGLVALDFDNCVRDGVVDTAVLELVQGTYAEFSPSGTGVRAFFTGQVADRKDHNKKGAHPFAIEFFAAKGYVTVTGNVLPEVELFGFDETVAPLTPAVLALYRERFGEAASTAGADDDDGAWLATLTPKIGLTMEQVHAGLELLDCDCGYDDWWMIGAALHHEFDGDEEAREAWSEWSSGSSKYPGDRALESKWASFGKSTTSPVTGAYFLRRVADARSHQRYDLVANWRGEINAAADEFALRERVCPLIAKDAMLGEMEREALAQALFERFKGLGTKYPIAQVRKLVAEKRSKKPAGDARVPGWAQQWVYVTDNDKFFRLDSDEWLSAQGFNARFNREVPCMEDGTIVKSASWLCLEDYQVPTVTRALYLPWADGLFEMDGVQCANTYRPSSVPEASIVISKKGQRAIDLVVRHLNLICGGRGEVVASLISWMAHNVQKPGVKIRWAPIIKGIEGDGKSLIGVLMSVVLGRPNVHTVSTKVLATDFSGFAEGACVAVLEEIKMTGHNRYDILNALKPNISNDSIEVHRKGKDAYQAINTVNYIGFTNYVDSLPLTDRDRRYFIIFTPFGTLEDLGAAVGSPVGGVGAYFDELHDAIQTQRADLRQWLLDWPIPDTFKPNGSAPMTAEKEIMVSMSRTPEEEVAREIIVAGAVGVGDKVLSSRCLTDAMMMHEDAVSVATTAVNRLLDRLGYTKVPKKLKWQNATHIVWVKGEVPSSTEVLRDALDATLKNGAAGVDFFTDD